MIRYAKNFKKIKGLFFLFGFWLVNLSMLRRIDEPSSIDAMTLISSSKLMQIDSVASALTKSAEASSKLSRLI